MTSVVLVIVVVLIVIVGFEVRQRMLFARKIASLTSSVMALREFAMEEIQYRPVGPGDEGLSTSPELFATAQKELIEGGLSVLGDQVESRADGTASGVTRWFADGSGTICGWFAPIRNRATGAVKPAMMFFSESEGGEYYFTNRGGSTRAVAGPDSIHRRFLEWNDGLARAIELHRSLLPGPQAGGGGKLRRIEGIGGAVALVKRLRRAVADWRASQASDALLEHDVQAVLQDRFKDLGLLIVNCIRSRTG
jgi:hypothetical protein